MKTIPPVCPEPETGAKYWRSLDDLADRPEVRQWVEREFPAGASLAPEGETRRNWFKLMSASFLFAGLGGVGAGCRRPEEQLTPFAKQPEGYVHGKPEYFASAMPSRGTAIPLVVTANDGRPTKIEGNPLHPDSNGGTDLFAQASILNLYDPDRAHRHLRNGGDVKIEAVRDLLSEVAKQFEANQGEGLALLTESSSSPTRARLQEAMAAKLPKAKWFIYEPVDFAVSAQAYSLAFGSRVTPHVHLDKAKRILSLDCDFIGSEQEAYHHIRGFAKGRKPGDDMNRLYVVESLMTLTGGNSDHRLRVKPSDVLKVAAQVAAALALGNGLPELTALAQGSPAPANWAMECAKDLMAHKGSAVVVAGYRQPQALHLLAAAMNQALGAIGSTVELLPNPEPAAHGSIGECVTALNAGLDTLVILGGNPAYNAPVDLEFSTAAAKANTLIRISYYEDETTALRAKKETLQIAGAHYLESWGDARTGDGTVVPVQPLIEPLFGGLTEIEILARLLADAKPSPYELVRATFGADDAAWRKFLHDGFRAASAGKAVSGQFNSRAVAGQLIAPRIPGGFEVVLFRDASLDDGRYNNNGWLQEIPDPITKITWDNVVLMSRATAKQLGVESSAHASKGQYDQHVVRVTVAGRSVEGPVWVQPGMADGTVGIALGYGRKVTGRVGDGVGVDAYPLYLNAARHLTAGGVQKIPRKFRLGVTQEHGMMEGRPVVREANLEQYKTRPDFAKGMDLDAHLPHYVSTKTVPDGRNPGRLQNIYEHPYDQNPETMSKIHQWGMVIDLGKCVGCSACVIACQSENNIPIVGKDQVSRGREMHWMRIDRYYSTNAAEDLRERDPAADPEMVTQPMLCQHCESAPCESVCPVNATVHDEEGLNVMAYNRCIGTRYCANNCPYKVRRFNWFDYNKRETGYGKAQDQHLLNFGNLYKGPFAENRNDSPQWEIVKLVKNPDVSVRMRGVMEKCTFCVQRIEQAKIARKVLAGNSGDVAVLDGTIKTACQQACPAEAIVFGNISDPHSTVSEWRKDARNYSVLGFLDTRPRVTYLARVRNPNPAMPNARSMPDSLRDYELFRHESPFQPAPGHDPGHGAAASPKHS
ncbi:MAG: 4Fe-4S dicluster domain-containing protein [Pedosphaera sp.]|nr:4Fe-4S dicluster domain-containing protein [Pedosphaera sp.]